ncbi:biotin synthase [Sarracenia purpurea var. burkii]
MLAAAANCAATNCAAATNIAANAAAAKEAGSTRFCMGAAWRETVGRKSNFNQILEYVKEIR